jgi:hypothetical protein
MQLAARLRRSAMALARGDQTALVGGHHHLGAVAEVELGEDPPDVGLDRLLGDDQVAGDLGVGQPAGDERQHLGLALGELLDPSRLYT